MFDSVYTARYVQLIAIFTRSQEINVKKASGDQQRVVRRPESSGSLGIGVAQIGSALEERLFVMRSASISREVLAVVKCPRDQRTYRNEDYRVLCASTFLLHDPCPVEKSCVCSRRI